MARRLAMRIGAIRANRLARIDSQNDPYFHSTCKRFSRIVSNLRFGIFGPPSVIRQEGVQFRRSETIRKHQVICANLRLDSRESGHLRCCNATSLKQMLGWTPKFRVVKTVFLENGVFAPYRKQVVLTKNGENDDLHSTHKNKGLRSSEPGKRRKWRKWRVSLRQNQGLPKTGFSPPWQVSPIGPPQVAGS